MKVELHFKQKSLNLTSNLLKGVANDTLNGHIRHIVVESCWRQSWPKTLLENPSGLTAIIKPVHILAHQPNADGSSDSDELYLVIKIPGSVHSIKLMPFRAPNQLPKIPPVPVFPILFMS